jgi:hypothetical protein
MNPVEAGALAAIVCGPGARGARRLGAGRAKR